MMFKPIILLLLLLAIVDAYTYKCYRGGLDVSVHDDIRDYHREEIVHLTNELFTDMLQDEGPFVEVFAAEKFGYEAVTIFMSISMDSADPVPANSVDLMAVVNGLQGAANSANTVNDVLICRIYNSPGCQIGGIFYTTYRGGQIANRKNAVSHEGRNNVTYGFQPVKDYRPSTSTKLAPQNGIPLCKRDDPKYYLWRCRAPHTMITGDVLRQGGKSYGCGNKVAPNSGYGYRLSLQNDGNIVAYDKDSKAVFATGTVIFPQTGPSVCPNV
ncbi:hypothetical protein BGZ81_003977 [Podila clonocystis]|nr:hypothetical protein BGZ81_003977 [Podila clonocystis]